MPHPRRQESSSYDGDDGMGEDSQAFGTSAASHVTGDVGSHITFKDLGRDYTEVIEPVHVTTTTPAVQAHPVHSSVGPVTTTTTTTTTTTAAAANHIRQNNNHGTCSSNYGGGNQENCRVGVDPSCMDMSGRFTEPTAAVLISIASAASQHSSSQQQRTQTTLGGGLDGSSYDEESPKASKSASQQEQSQQGKSSESPSSWFQGKNKLFLIAGLMLLVVVIGAVVGIVVAVAAGVGGGSNEPGGLGDATTAGSGVGDDIVLQRVQSPVHGEVESRFGYSLSLNGDGTRMAVADVESVTVYEQVGHADWTVLGSKIESPGNTTTAKGLLEGGRVFIRAPVVCKISADGSSVAVGWSSYDHYFGIVKVYRFNAEAGGWKLHGEPIRGDVPNGFFGAALDLSEDGSVIAVGVPGSGGLVCIYTFNAGQWVKYGTQLTKDDVGDLTITSVALAADGKTLAFGGVAGTAETVARMYKYDILTGDWREHGTGLQSTQDGTAYVVDLSGDGATVAISNYYYLESNPGENNDALDVRAYIWSADIGDWVQLGDTLHAFFPGAKSGYFISLSDDGRTMVMGDPGREGEDGLGGGNTGHAHIYIFDGTEWYQLGPNVEGEGAGDHFGYDVTVSGDGTRFASSSPYSRALGTGDPHGRVLVFEIPQE